MSANQTIVSGRRGVTATLRAIPALALIALTTASCTPRPDPTSATSAFAARRQVKVRAELPPSAPVVATLSMGDPVEILARRRNSVKVRIDQRVEGWARGDELISNEAKLDVERLKNMTSALPPQGLVRAFEALNVHLEPYRWSESIYQLAKDEGGDLLQHRLVERREPDAPSGDGVFEDWFLVRLPNGEAGWLLATRVYSAIPVEVAQYAERKPIIAYFAMDEVTDESRGVSKATWLWTQASSRRTEYDFDRVRVFRWNARGDAYQTIHLRTRLAGYLPVRMLGEVRTPNGSGLGFSYVVEDEGRRLVRTYALIGQRVRFVSETATAVVPPIVLDRSTTPARPPSLQEQLLDWWDQAILGSGADAGSAESDESGL